VNFCLSVLSPWPFIAWRGDRFNRVPTLSNPAVYALVRDTQVRCPLGDSLSHPVDCDASNALLVDRLFGPRSPATVVRSIAFVVIDSFKSLATRWIAHVSVKVLKFQPPVTYCDPALAVSGMITPAPSEHAAPLFVDAGLAHAVRRYFCLLSDAATTRLCVARNQRPSKHPLLGAAVAFDVPEGHPSAFGPSGLPLVANNKFAEPPPFEVVYG